jgi:hypothetical protein
MVDTCAAPLGDLGNAITVQAVSDIDGDGTLSLVATFAPSIKAKDGTVNVAAPAATGGDQTNCNGDGTQPGTIGNGQVTTCSSDNIF